MLSAMQLQITFSCETLVALQTSVRLLPALHCWTSSDMGFQLGLVGVIFVAMLALEWPLSGMGSQMDHQGRLI